MMGIETEIIDIEGKGGHKVYTLSKSSGKSKDILQSVYLIF